MLKDRRVSRPWWPSRREDTKRPLPRLLAERKSGIPKARNDLISSFFVHPALTLKEKKGASQAFDHLPPSTGQ